MKIVVLESLSVNPGDLDWDWLDAFGTVEIYPRMADPEETAARLQGAEVVAFRRSAGVDVVYKHRNFERVFLRN